MTLGPALLLLLGGYLVVTGQTTVGTVVSIVTILPGRLAGSSGSLGNLYVNGLQLIVRGLAGIVPGFRISSVGQQQVDDLQSTRCVRLYAGEWSPAKLVPSIGQCGIAIQ